MAPMSTFDRDYEAVTGSAVPEGLSPQLREYWTRPVSELATLREPGPNRGAQERHRIFSLMLMSLVHEYWNGNKKGRAGEYPWNEAFDPAHPESGRYLADDYRGHNIAAVAVNRDGVVIDFEFNHNRLFNSSAEHAEARLVRRIFALAQLSDTWRPAMANSPADEQPLDDYTTLAEVTIYTSLESCAQCAGTMALGRVREVVYLQTDPGMYFIGRILRNLTDVGLRAPLPISAGEIGLSYFGELDTAFTDFVRRVATEPFWRNGTVTDTSPSVTSFLCTKNARDIYGEARREFANLNADSSALAYPDYRPGQADGSPITTAKSNADALDEARDFLAYAITSGRRGTPHH
jgi:tRNA(Arg) A34 adenosine deaminase TadA